MKLLADYHTHTSYGHATGTAEENVRRAVQCGLSRIAITEHAPAHVFYGVRGKALLALYEEVQALKTAYRDRVEVLFGLECNLTAFGECDAPQDLPCDLLLLAYHKGVFPRDALVCRAAAEAMHLSHADPVRVSEGLLAACEKYRITVLSHPSRYVKCDIARLARGARELGVLLELNESRLSLTDAEILLAAEEGAHFVIGSDAHAPERVGTYETCLKAAERLGICSLVENIGPECP